MYDMYDMSDLSLAVFVSSKCQVWKGGTGRAECNAMWNAQWKLELVSRCFKFTFKWMSQDYFFLDNCRVGLHCELEWCRRSSNFHCTHRLLNRESLVIRLGDVILNKTRTTLKKREKRKEARKDPSSRLGRAKQCINISRIMSWK